MVTLAPLEGTVTDAKENPRVRAEAAEELAHAHRRKTHSILLKNLSEPSKMFGSGVLSHSARWPSDVPFLCFANLRPATAARSEVFTQWRKKRLMQSRRLPTKTATPEKEWLRVLHRP
jgi:hypothetical protein